MKIERLEVSAFRVPTPEPEVDGTFQWESTTLVLVEAVADSDLRGLGYSYTSAGAAAVVKDLLAEAVVGQDVEAVGQAWQGMLRRVRNVGLAGIAAAAISAVDVALWDLKARAMVQPLWKALGGTRPAVPVYGSGGFTSYSPRQLIDEMTGWADQGIPRGKMKVGKDWGRQEAEDLARVMAVRQAVGDGFEVMVDANGAYQPKQALRMAERFQELSVAYFEEPVAYDSLQQLAYVRKRSPIPIASGENAYTLHQIRDTLVKEAVDILQADATRCLGVTGCLKAAEYACGFGIPFSTHTAPSIHVHVACAVPQIEHVEYFVDHVRIEELFFDGFLHPVDGYLRPDPDRPGLGLAFKRQDAECWRIAG